LYDFKGCTESALAASAEIACSTTLDPPSRAALQAHISDLEADLRNVDFRLQNFYHQRSVISSILEDAVTKLRVEYD